MDACMTAEEWAEASVEGSWFGQGLRVDTEPDCLVLIQGADEVVVQRGGSPYQEQCHALAALCLHGQPFGFQRHMVRRLRQSADVMDTALRSAWANELREIADRIEALLPPEES